ncbi:MAG: RNA polymerase sigma factor [Lachnospiraceae bacterium]|nr:RNA polymerase sigma factor [Lachnospiraceae bacterium]
MANLDYKYLAELVKKAQQGSSNAFAELYAATYQKQFRYSYKYLQDEFLAQDALQETFVTALKSIGTLQNPELFVAWLNQINFRICYDMKKKQKNEVMDEDTSKYYYETMESSERVDDEIIKVDSKNYILNQVMTLPLTESQVILMRYYQRLTLDEIGQNLDISRSTVKRYLKAGRMHLDKLLQDMQ